jgi:hypothetical protein
MSKITEINLNKQFKKGLPNYSSMMVGASITWTFEEGEEINYEEMWQEIDSQIGTQTDIDPDWIQVSQTKNDYKVKAHFPKTRNKNVGDYGVEEF